MNTLKLLLVTLALMMVSQTAVAALYRWVDAQGQVHYSDTPQKGAEEIQLQRTNVFRGSSSGANNSARSEISSEPGRAPSNAVEGGEEVAVTSYQSLRIISPSKEQTLRNTGGKIQVRAQIVPNLQKGHGIVFYLDGTAVNPEPVAGTSVTLEDVYRGQHTIRASVFSPTGVLLKTGDTTSFFVQQTTKP